MGWFGIILFSICGFLILILIVGFTCFETDYAFDWYWKFRKWLNKDLLPHQVFPEILEWERFDTIIFLYDVGKDTETEYHFLSFDSLGNVYLKSESSDHREETDDVTIINIYKVKRLTINKRYVNEMERNNISLRKMRTNLDADEMYQEFIKEYQRIKTDEIEIYKEIRG